MSIRYFYDVAVSYQSETEKSVGKIVDYLLIEGWKIFFAPIKQDEMFSEKLHVKLYDIYRNKSLLKVLFVTEKYLKSEWTQLEMSVAMESTKNEERRLLIVNFLNWGALPEKLNQYVYVDGNKYREHEIAGIISKRLRELVGSENFDERKGQESGDCINKSVIIQNNDGVIAFGDANLGDMNRNGYGKGV